MTDLQFKPLITFNSSTDTGVDEVPLNSLVSVIDWTGEHKLLLFISNSDLNASSTVADMVQDTNYTLVHTNGVPEFEFELENDLTPELYDDLNSNGNIISDFILD